MATFPYVGFLDGQTYPSVPTGTTTVTVNSSSALATALTNATAGQRILLAAATYSGSFTLSGKSGTASSGITIEAATPGTAIFASGTTFTVNNCAYITLKGLTFPYELSSGNVLGFRGTTHHSRVTRCTFGPTAIGTAGSTKATFVYGGDTVEHIRVDHNEFRNKTNPGNAILFDGNFTTLQACKHIRIDHNIVRSIKPEVSNEKEPIRLGVSTMSKTMSYSVVERNFFTDCICEPEIVSVKAGGVRVSGNTVLRTIGGLVYRHGVSGVMADNYIVDRAGTFGTTIGSGGFRFYDSGHEVSYNYVDSIYGGNFQNALMLDTGDAEGSSTNLAGHWRVVNALVERNVLVGNPTGIVIGDNYDSAPTGCTIRDNIVAQAATGIPVTQKIAPVSSTLTNNAYYPTPAGGGMAQGSDTIWRKAGFGPRLTYLQQADVGPNADLADSDGTGVLVGGTGGSGGGGTAPDGTAATKFSWGAPLGQSDEFEYTGSPQSTKWSLYDGPGHDDNGRRVPARTTVANGKLIGTGLNNGDSFGMAHRFDQQYGRWEVRMRCFETGTVIAGARYHVVLIIWPDSDQWPEDGEYDFVELSIPGQQTLGAFMHFPHDANVDVQQREFTKAGVDTSQFHNYALEWTPDALVGYVDGEEWFRTSGGASSIRRDIQSMPSGHLTIQLDNFDGTNQTPATMEVEWARVYSLTPSGPVAGPQSVSTVGIGSAEAFGVPTVTGAIPALPSGSVIARLGQNTVLGGSTLGYTSGSVTPTPPGVQTVSGAGGIPTGQSFGRPVLTVADGPQTIAPTGIVTAEAFGRPRVGIGPPASPPAPGGVLVPTLFAVAADGITLSPLPAWESMTLSPVRNSAGAVEIAYPAGAPGFQLLHDAVSASPLRALEIRVWLGGNATGALGGWLVSKSGDDLEPGSPWRFSGHFHEWLLAKAIVAPQAISEANKSGALSFTGATAGLILSTVMDQAKARGALPLVSRDFTVTHDSNGNPWAKEISSLKLAPKTTLAQVADKLVELAMCEYEFTAGRVWRAFNPGGRGTDRTTGVSTPLVFAAGVDLSEAARRESMRDAGTAVLVAGSEGFYKFASSATAQAQLGWRAEVGVDAGQLTSQSAVDAVAPSYLETASAGVAEHNAAVEFGPGAPIPLLDYAVGDWAYLATGTGRERMRIAQVVLEFGQDAPARGKVVFNDLITDRITALYRRLNAISTGDAVVGTSEPTPGGAGDDIIPPAAPEGVTVSSTFAYQVPGETVTLAEVSAGWAPVTADAYVDAETAGKARLADLLAARIRGGVSPESFETGTGTTTTTTGNSDKVSAARYIHDRLASDKSIYEDWTWSGAPSVVGQYNDALLGEYEKANPKAQAAEIIYGRIDSGQAIFEDWTWSGMPAVVGQYNDALIVDFEKAHGSASPVGSTAKSWLFDYLTSAQLQWLSAYSGGGSTTTTTTSLGGWTFYGQPDWAPAYAAALKKEWEDDPDFKDADTGNPVPGGLLAWLSAYEPAHRGGGSITADVASYVVQYQYLGVQGVGVSIFDPLDPGTNDGFWETPDNSPTTQTLLVFGNIEGGRALGVRVAAVDRSGNQGPWSEVVAIDTAVDDKPPPSASKPVVKAGFRQISVTWDGKGSAGEDMVTAAPDFLSGGGVEIHVAQGIDFTPDRPTGAAGKVDLSLSTTYQNVFYDAGRISLNGFENGVTYFVRLVSTDRNGNAAEPSETSDPVTPNKLVTIDYGPDTVDRATIRAAAIGSAEIDLLAVNEQHVGSVNASAIVSGTVDADIVVGGRFATPLSATGNQVEFDSAGLRLRQGNTVVGRWQTSDASMLMTGTYLSALSGERINILPDGSFRMYGAAGVDYASIENAGGVVRMRSRADSTGRRAYVDYDPTGFRAWYGAPGAVRSLFYCEQTYSVMNAPVTGVRIYRHIPASDGTTPRWHFVTSTATGDDSASIVHLERVALASNHAYLFGATSDAGIVFDSGFIGVTHNNISPADIHAAGFIQVSAIEAKRDIAPVRFGRHSARSIAQAARAKSFYYHSDFVARAEEPDAWLQRFDEESGDRLPDERADWTAPQRRPVMHVGPMADDLLEIAPEIVHRDLPRRGPAPSGLGLGVGTVAGLAYAGVGELADEVDELRAQLRRLADRVDPPPIVIDQEPS